MMLSQNNIFIAANMWIFRVRYSSSTLNVTFSLAQYGYQTSSLWVCM